jgi:hypothetical protein
MQFSIIFIFQNTFISMIILLIAISFKIYSISGIILSSKILIIPVMLF